MQKIFISYSRKDIDFVRKLAADLEKAEYDVWWDITDLQGGDDWVNTIPDAIASSQYVIVVLTPNSIKSEWVRKEYTQALSLRKKIIPIMLVPCSVPFALNTINFVNFAVGEYTDNFKKLLSPLGYSGEPPAVTPYKKFMLASLPPAFFKFGIPGILGLILLAFFILLPQKEQTQETPTFTPSPTTAASPTFTTTLEPPTATSTDTASPTPTSTATITPTATFTPTLSQAFTLPICVYAIDSSANVREGPSTNDDILGKIDTDGTKCPLFSARIVNEDRQVWFQFSHKQDDEFQLYADRWISGSSLAAFDLPKPLPLPVCVYNLDDPGDLVNVRILPGEDKDTQGNSLKADGSNCPFFDTRLENEEGIWYHVAPNQKEQKDDFGQYAGGWIHEASLVVHTFNSPIITLTPTSIFTVTPSFTPTFTLTPSPTNTPSSTPTNTDTPIPTSTVIPTATETSTPES